MRREDRLEIGALGEALAARELERRGWRVLARNWQARSVEVDLVAVEAGSVVCVEVKTSTAAAGAKLDPLVRPGRRFDRQRMARQRRATALAAERLGLERGRARVALVEVWIDLRRRRASFLVHSDLAAPIGNAGATEFNRTRDPGR